MPVAPAPPPPPPSNGGQHRGGAVATMGATVIEHVLRRLQDIGVGAVFGVPGDYSFGINDAAVDAAGLRWVGCSNELNAAYAADGYARVKGVGVVVTTFGVGELSALNGIAGAYAEHVPVVHLVGTPSTATRAARAVVHHTLGDGNFGLFQAMTAPVVAAASLLTPENAAAETERLLHAATYHRRPVYMAIPTDVATAPVLGAAPPPLPPPPSNADALHAATDAVVRALDAAATAVVLPGVLVARAGLAGTLEAFVTRAGLPHAAMFRDKAVLDEALPGYVGIYSGGLRDPDMRAFVEGSDAILCVGALMTDWSTGAFTADLDAAKTIHIEHHAVTVGGKTYASVQMGDVLRALADRPWPAGRWRRGSRPEAAPVVGHGGEAITKDALYPRWARFLRAGDVVVTDTGTSSMGLAFHLLPPRATYHNQSLYGSIGWATPAALGAAVATAATAADESRVVLVTGEGSLQLTVQALGQFARYGLRPVVFVLNNSGYLIERLLCADPEKEYNDVARWDYLGVAAAVGCSDWLRRSVKTCGEFDAALDAASTATTGVLIEVVTDKYVSSDFPRLLHEHQAEMASK